MSEGPVRTGRRWAFTLIELLVVVAIIAMLISILLPALGKAKENGRRAVCLSNLHHLGVAFHQYFEANNDILPDARMIPQDDGGDANRPTIMQFLMPYARNPMLFQCPSDMPGQSERTEPNSVGKSFWESEQTSFEYTPIVLLLNGILEGTMLRIRANVKVGDVTVKWGLPFPPPPEAQRFLKVRTSDLHLLKEFSPFHGKQGGSKAYQFADDPNEESRQTICHTLYADCHVEEKFRIWIPPIE